MASSLPQVGLEAIIAGLPGFTAGANTINAAYDAIEKKASAVEKASRNLGSAVSSVTSPFVNLGQSVLSFGAAVSGASLIGVGALTAGIVALGATALNETAKYERMSLSITNLVAREISQGQVVQQQRQVLAGLTAKETEELQKLQGGLDNEANQRDVLNARIQEQKEKIRQLTAQYGEQGLVVIKERAELQGMELDLSDLNQEIGNQQNRITELSGKQGQMVTVMEKVRTGQMSMTDAMKQAAPRAQELLKWIQVLAIQSPFGQEDIANTFRTALAYGFTTEQAQRLTSAMVDFTSATGKTGESANLIALALGQIQARGKLSAQELRQLSEQGVGVNKILEDMGFSLDDVTNGLVPVDQFMEAVTKDMEVFKGAAKSQSTTLAGLMASLGDLKSIGLREFFTSTFSAIQPYAASFVDWLTNAALETGAIRKLGEALGQYVGNAIKSIGTFIAVIKSGGLAVFSKYLGVEGIPLWYQLQELITNISGILSGLGSTITSNLSGPFSDFTTNIVPMITQAITFINDNFESFKGALMGIGAVLAVGVFAALVAGILSLLSPINLIIAGAALLGAAWAGNWGNIQGITYATWATIQPVFQQVATWLQTNIPVAIQILSSFWTNILMPAMLVVGAWITGTLIPNLSMLWGWFQTNLPIAIQFLTSTWLTILWPALQAVGNYISGTVVPAIMELWGWVQDNLPAATQGLSDMWTGTLLPALTSVWSFFNTSLMPLWVSFIGFVNAVVMKSVQALAGLWQNVLLPALQNVWKFMQDNVLPIFVAAGQKLGGEEGLGPILKNMAENVLPVFKKAMDGVKNAIKEATDFFKSLASAVNNFQLPDILQPGSPTPFEIALIGIANAAHQAGNAMRSITITQSQIDSILGLNRSIASNANIIHQAEKTLARFYEKNNLEENKLEIATRQLTALFAENQQTILSAANPGEMFQKIARQAGALSPSAGFTGDPSRIALKGFNVFLNGFRDATTRLNKLQQEAMIQAGRTALNVGNKLSDVVNSSADILNTRVETLQALVDSGLEKVNFEGQIVSATRAQELLNQALTEQRDIQDDILQAKQNEQKLNFLEKQLDLIETINNAGLNVQDILGGLTLGVNASIPDLITATNRLVTAMITQVNEDLQIHSPSKVMTGLFKQAGMGAVRGLINTIPMVQNAASQIGNAIINVPMGQANPSNNTSTTNNYNFSMTVPTQASPQGVIRQYQTMRAMVA